ncbi:glycosyltransferase family 2 protein [Nitrospira sp. Nam74]
MNVTKDINREERIASPHDSAVGTQKYLPSVAGCISVVVPTHQRPELLNRCLTALFSQTLDASKYEIIIVDDAPSENTKQIVSAWTVKSGPRVRYLANGGRHGPAAARNKGWQAAGGEIIAFTDDDCIPAPDWLAVGFAAFEDGTVQGLSGRIIVPIPEIPSDYERTVAGLERGPFATANCWYRRSTLFSVGGFDERFTVAWREDTDLEFACRRSGFRLVVDPRAVVVHPVRPTTWGISVRLQRNNLFNALLYKKHPDLYQRFIQSTPPWRYYVTLIALLTASIGVAAGSMSVALLSLMIWLGLTTEFCLRRLARTSRRLDHVLEMIVTSVLIPPVAIFWRVRGALKYHVAFL